MAIGLPEIIILAMALSLSGIPSLVLYRIKGARSHIPVPGWIGWVAVVTFLLYGLAWLVFSAWVYSKGKSDGRRTGTDEQPRGRAFWATVGWVLLSCSLIFTSYAVVHLPTMLYREGVRVGATQG